MDIEVARFWCLEWQRSFNWSITWLGAKTCQKKLGARYMCTRKKRTSTYSGKFKPFAWLSLVLRARFLHITLQTSMTIELKISTYSFAYVAFHSSCRSGLSANARWYWSRIPHMRLIAMPDEDRQSWNTNACDGTVIWGISKSAERVDTCLVG